METLKIPFINLIINELKTLLISSNSFRGSNVDQRINELINCQKKYIEMAQKHYCAEHIAESLFIYNCHILRKNITINLKHHVNYNL